MKGTDQIVDEVLNAAFAASSEGRPFIATGTGGDWQEVQGMEVSPCGNYWGSDTSKWTWAKCRKMKRLRRTGKDVKALFR